MDSVIYFLQVFVLLLVVCHVLAALIDAADKVRKNSGSQVILGVGAVMAFLFGIFVCFSAGFQFDLRHMMTGKEFHIEPYTLVGVHLFSVIAALAGGWYSVSFLNPQFHDD